LSRSGLESQIVVVPNTLDEPFCKDRQNEQPLCFFYESLFIKLDVRLPLSPFKNGVLIIMNVAPAQLHPNNWAFIRVFQILCTHFDITPTRNMLFYFFEFKPSKRTSRASLNGVSGRGLLLLFQSSYKTFKGKFLKIQTDCPDSNLLTRFHLYWSPRPQSQTPRSVDDLKNNELNGCTTLDHLDTIFETSVLLKLEPQPSDVKVYIDVLLLHYFSIYSFFILTTNPNFHAQKTMSLSRADMRLRLKKKEKATSIAPSDDSEKTDALPLK